MLNINKILFITSLIILPTVTMAATDRGSALQYKRELLQKMNKGGFSDIDKYIQNKTKATNAEAMPSPASASAISVQIPANTTATIEKLPDSLITPPSPPIRTMEEAAKAGINPMVTTEPVVPIQQPSPTQKFDFQVLLSLAYWKELGIVPIGIGVSFLILLLLILKRRNG